MEYYSALKGMQGWSGRSSKSACLASVPVPPRKKEKKKDAKHVKKKKNTGVPSSHVARCRWLTPVILATQEAEIRRIVVQSQLQQIVCETLS
jgi:hypothetical protein